MEDKEVSNRFFVMRLTEAELAAFEALARADNRSKSNYLKNLLALKVDESLGTDEKFTKEFSKFIAKELAKEIKEVEKAIKNPKKLEIFAKTHQIGQLMPGETPEEGFKRLDDGKKL